MNYDDYKESRILTWRILIDRNITALPISIDDICRAYKIRLQGYSQAHSLLDSMGLCDICNETDGFTIGSMIFYDDNNCSLARQRFTVAHELGHLILGHTGSLYNRDPNPMDDPKETAANVFASRLLSPACVLWGCGVTNAEQIVKLCNISHQAAWFRMMRLQKLYDREQLFIREHGHSCFLMHPLERQVFEQFTVYIDNVKGLV